METYHKISTPFKRYMDGPNKSKLMIGQWAVEEFQYLADNEWEFTEKVDGTNIRIELRRGYDFYSAEYAGRSDNASIPVRLRESLEAMFPTYPSWRGDLNKPAYRERYGQILEWMMGIEQGESVILFGEGYGPKIQGGGKYRDDHSFVLFDVKIGPWWLKRDDVNDVAEKLGIDSVPVIGHGTLWQAINYVKYGTPYHDAEVRQIRAASSNNCWLDYANGLTSQWGNFEAEGIVARPAVPLFTRRGDRIITKIKGVDFR